jgi:toxin ParE1/3/4
MKGIRVSSLAEQDLDSIWYRIAAQSGSIEIANGVVDSITETFALFASTPEAGTRRNDIESGVRGFPVGKYLIYYRDTERFVVISRVIHGMRDQSTAYCGDSED